MKVTIEHTDLYCGSANYSWLNRASIDSDGLTDNQITRRLKKKIGINVLKSRLMFDDGNSKQYKIDGLNQTFFITYGY